MKKLIVAILMLVFSVNLLASDPLPSGAKIVYVRSRVPQGRMPYLPDAHSPTASEHSELWLLDVDSGQASLLYNPGETSAVCDTAVSRDGKFVYCARIDKLPDGGMPGKQPHNQQSDIYRVEIATGNAERLTHQETEPLPNRPRISRRRGGTEDGVINLGPCPSPGGWIAFTSDRELPGRQMLYRMREDGGDVERIGPMNLGSALNPVLLSNGRIIFSSHEDQGFRDRRQWGLWSINPDGTYWAPEFSAFTGSDVFKFHGEAIRSDGSRRIVSTKYYPGSDAGFGMPFSRPLNGPIPEFTQEFPPTLSHDITGFFWPVDAQVLAQWSTAIDHSATVADGKLSRFSVGPQGYVLCAWTPGPCYGFANNHPPTDAWDGVTYMDAGIYLLPVGGPTDGPGVLVKVWDEPGWNEYDARIVGTWESVYGVTPPISTVPKWNHPMLPKGSPYGLIGTSSVYNRESKSLRTDEYGIMHIQGGDRGDFDDEEIVSIRILTMESDNNDNQKDPRSIDTMLNHDEKLRILGEIPLRKFNADGSPVIDSQGNPDTSFLARIPADVPFTFELVDDIGQSLTISQTWHQLRPGEIRQDCGGCHAHTKTPLQFEFTAAAKSDYQITDLVGATPQIFEYNRDINPIFQKYKCSGCHDGSFPDAPVIEFSDWSTRASGGSYGKLFGDYMKPYQSRRSLLMRHLRGDAGFSQMPKNSEPLTADEIQAVAKWIDTGMAWGKYVTTDVTKPTISCVRDGGEILVGVYDFELDSVSVKLDGQDQSLPSPTDHTYRFTSEATKVVVTAADKTGNSVAREFHLNGSTPNPRPSATADELQQRIDQAIKILQGN